MATKRTTYSLEYQTVLNNRAQRQLTLICTSWRSIENRNST